MTMPYTLVLTDRSKSREEHHEQQLVPEIRSRREVRRPVARIDICDGRDQAWSDEMQVATSRVSMRSDCLVQSKACCLRV
jgi:hypothetical protein